MQEAVVSIAKAELHVRYGTAHETLRHADCRGGDIDCHAATARRFTTLYILSLPILMLACCAVVKPRGGIDYSKA